MGEGVHCDFDDFFGIFGDCFFGEVSPFAEIIVGYTSASNRDNNAMFSSFGFEKIKGVDLTGENDSGMYFVMDAGSMASASGFLLDDEEADWSGVGLSTNPLLLVSGNDSSDGDSLMRLQAV